MLEHVVGTTFWSGFFFFLPTSHILILKWNINLKHSLHTLACQKNIIFFMKLKLILL